MNVKQVKSYILCRDMAHLCQNVQTVLLIQLTHYLKLAHASSHSNPILLFLNVFVLLVFVCFF